MPLDLVELAHVDAVLITCSTMNRAYRQVREALEPYQDRRSSRSTVP